MDKLLIGLNAIKDDKGYNEQIFKNFLGEFCVDLKDSRYINGEFTVKWNLLLQKCSDSKCKESLQELIHLFNDKFFDVIDVNRKRENSIPIREKERALREQNIQELGEIINKYTALLEDCYIYEADIWLNAWLVLRYIKAEETRLEKDREIKSRALSSRKPKTGFVDTATGYVRGKNNREYRLPFENDADGFFGGKYLECTLSNTGALFWTEKSDKEEEEEKFGKEERERKDSNSYKSYKEYRKDIFLCLDVSYSRFTYHNIMGIEEQEGFCIEDKILFHKTINGVLLRNMINTMIASKKDFEAENYIYLINQLCGCKSLVWQNLIGYFCVFLDAYKYELKALNIYGNLYVMLCAWIMHIEKINYKLRILTEGFIYLYNHNHHDDRIFPKKCYIYLKKLKLKTGTDSKKYWSNILKEESKKEEATKKFRVTADVKQNHREFKWIYAILQREVINVTKYLYADNKFCEKMSVESIKISYGDKIVERKTLSKIVDFQPDIEGAVEKIKKDLARKNLIRILKQLAEEKQNK